MQSCPRFEGSPYSECWCPVLHSVVAFFIEEGKQYVHSWGNFILTKGTKVHLPPLGLAFSWTTQWKKRKAINNVFVNL